jgi:hypothetical protein
MEFTPKTPESPENSLEGKFVRARFTFTASGYANWQADSGWTKIVKSTTCANGNSWAANCDFAERTATLNVISRYGNDYITNIATPTLTVDEGSWFVPSGDSAGKFVMNDALTFAPQPANGYRLVGTELLGCSTGVNIDPQANDCDYQLSAIGSDGKFTAPNEDIVINATYEPVIYSYDLVRSCERDNGSGGTTNCTDTSAYKYGLVDSENQTTLPRASGFTAGETITAHAIPQAGTYSYDFKKWESAENAVTFTCIADDADCDSDHPEQSRNVQFTVKSASLTELTSTYTVKAIFKQQAEITHPTPAAVIDFVAQTLKGLTASTAYKACLSDLETVPACTNSLYKDVTADTNGVLQLSGLLTGIVDGNLYGKTVLIAQKGDGNWYLDSEKQSILIPERPLAPTGITTADPLAGSDGRGALVVPDGTEYSTLEYRQTAPTAGDWKPFTSANEKVALGTYSVRVKATESAFRSPETAGLIVKNYLDAPVFAVEGSDELTAPIDVSFEVTENDIHYTTDGSEPACTSTIYEQAFTLNLTSATPSITVKAIACLTGHNSSDIVTQTYALKLSDVTFDKGEGAGDTPVVQSIWYGGHIGAVAVPVPVDEHIFLGYFAGEVQYIDASGEPVISDATKITEAVDLVAKYEHIDVLPESELVAETEKQLVIENVNKSGELEALIDVNIAQNSGLSKALQESKLTIDGIKKGGYDVIAGYTATITINNADTLQNLVAGKRIATYIYSDAVYLNTSTIRVNDSEKREFDVNIPASYKNAHELGFYDADTGEFVGWADANVYEIVPPTPPAPPKPVNKDVPNPANVKLAKTSNKNELKVTWTIPSATNVASYKVTLNNVTDTAKYQSVLFSGKKTSVATVAANKLQAVFTNISTGTYKVTVQAIAVSGGKSSAVIASAGNVQYKLTVGSKYKFTDLKGITSDRKNDINWLSQVRVTVGNKCDSKGAGKNCVYMPKNSVNRGAMAQFLYKLAGETKTVNGVPKVSDISKLVKDRKNAINWLASEGITVIDDEYKYNPQNTVNRGAMAEFMYKLAGHPGTIGFDSKDGKDHVDPKTVAAQEKILKNDKKLAALKKSNPNRYYDILWLAKMNITVPDKGKYNPQNTVNRGAMAQFMHKLYYVMMTGNPVPADGNVPNI